MQQLVTPNHVSLRIRKKWERVAPLAAEIFRNFRSINANSDRQDSLRLTNQSWDLRPTTLLNYGFCLGPRTVICMATDALGVLGSLDDSRRTALNVFTPGLTGHFTAMAAVA